MKKFIDYVKKNLDEYNSNNVIIDEDDYTYWQRIYVKKGKLLYEETIFDLAVELDETNIHDTIKKNKSLKILYRKFIVDSTLT